MLKTTTTHATYKTVPCYSAMLRVYRQAEEIAQMPESSDKIQMQNDYCGVLLDQSSFLLRQSRLLFRQALAAAMDGRPSAASMFEGDAAVAYAKRFHALTARNVLYGATGGGAMAWAFKGGELIEAFNAENPFPDSL